MHIPKTRSFPRGIAFYAACIVARRRTTAMHRKVPLFSVACVSVRLTAVAGVPINRRLASTKDLCFALPLFARFTIYAICVLHLWLFWSRINFCFFARPSRAHSNAMDFAGLTWLVLSFAEDCAHPAQSATFSSLLGVLRSKFQQIFTFSSEKALFDFVITKNSLPKVKGCSEHTQHLPLSFAEASADGVEESLFFYKQEFVILYYQIKFVKMIDLLAKFREFNCLNILLAAENDSSFDNMQAVETLASQGLHDIWHVPIKESHLCSLPLAFNRLQKSTFAAHKKASKSLQSCRCLQLASLPSMLSAFSKACDIFNLESIHELMDACISLPENALSNFQKSFNRFQQKREKFFDPKSVFTWNFSPHGKSIDELVLVAYEIFRASRCLEALQIDAEKFCKFLLIVQANYLKNEYHNFHHAVDCLQSAFVIYNTIVEGTKMADAANYALEPLDLLGLLVAAFCHDLGHPGFTNSFLINAEHPLALLYNDRSILENFHSFFLFSLLHNAEFNFLSHISKEKYTEFRRIVTTSILATDMAFHYDYVNQIKCRTESNTQDPFTTKKNSDKLLLVAGVMKAADISNVARIFCISAKWAEALLDEFKNQGSIEAKCGMAVFPLGHLKEVERPKSQCDFISFVGIPLYESLNNLTFGSFKGFIQILKENLFFWTEKNNFFARCSGSGSHANSQKTSEPSTHCFVHTQKCASTAASDAASGFLCDGSGKKAAAAEGRGSGRLEKRRNSSIVGHMLPCVKTAHVHATYAPSAAIDSMSWMVLERRGSLPENLLVDRNEHPPYACSVSPSSDSSSSPS